MIDGVVNFGLGNQFAAAHHFSKKRIQLNQLLLVLEAQGGKSWWTRHLAFEILPGFKSQTFILEDITHVLCYGRSRCEPGRLDSGHIDESLFLCRTDNKIVGVADCSQTCKFGDGVAFGYRRANLADRGKYLLCSPITGGHVIAVLGIFGGGTDHHGPVVGRYD